MRPPLRTAIAVLSLLAAASTASAAPATIHYTMSPVFERDSLAALAVELRFRGDPDGETTLELPDAWGGKTGLHRGIRDLDVRGGTLAPADTAPARRVVRHAPSAALLVRYRVVQFWDGEPTADGTNEYRPVIQKNYFHVVGNAVFVRPETSGATPVTFRFERLPRGWNFASDLEHGALDLVSLIQSISVGGDFRVRRDGPLRVAIRGALPFSDSAFTARLRPIIASHHRFFGDPESRYLVTVLPLQSDPSMISVGGTGLDDAFAFFATSNADEERLNRVLAHEHLHTWIPRRLGSMPDPDDAAGYWFSEGFTDFYTNRLLLRDGLMTVEQYAEAFNEALSALASSPVREAPNARIVSDFWRDPDVGKLPYQRGFAIAALWDAKLREASGGARDLDDVMLAMQAICDTAREPYPLVTTLVVEQLARFGVDVRDDALRHIERGEPIVLPADLGAPCARIEKREVAEFHRGFDAMKTSQAGNVVSGLDPESPAYRAGLREGMRILERKSGKIGDSTVPLVYRVQDGDVEREITYLPEARGRFTLQRLVLQPGADCAARLSGAR